MWARASARVHFFYKEEKCFETAERELTIAEQIQNQADTYDGAQHSP